MKENRVLNKPAGSGDDSTLLGKRKVDQMTSSSSSDGVSTPSDRSSTASSRKSPDLAALSSSSSSSSNGADYHSVHRQDKLEAEYSRLAMQQRFVVNLLKNFVSFGEGEIDGVMSREEGDDGKFIIINGKVIMNSLRRLRKNKPKKGAAHNHYSLNQGLMRLFVALGYKWMESFTALENVKELMASNVVRADAMGARRKARISAARENRSLASALQACCMSTHRDTCNTSKPNHRCRGCGNVFCDHHYSAENKRGYDRVDDSEREYCWYCDMGRRLWEAVQKGDMKDVFEALDTGAPVLWVHPQFPGITTLHIAAERNDVDLLSILIHSFPKAFTEAAVKEEKEIGLVVSEQERDNPLLQPFLTDVLTHILVEGKLKYTSQTALLLWNRGAGLNNSYMNSNLPGGEQHTNPLTVVELPYNEIHLVATSQSRSVYTNIGSLFDGSNMDLESPLEAKWGRVWLPGKLLEVNLTRQVATIRYNSLVPDLLQALQTADRLDQRRSNRYLLCSDMSCGMESVPIPCVNEVDASPDLPNFIYVLQNVEGPGVYIDWLKRRSDDKKCNGCWTDLPNPQPCKDSCSHVVSGKGELVECSYSCAGCTTKYWYTAGRKTVVNCGKRDMQSYLKWNLEIFKTKHKGWGVRTLQPIAKGSFVCEYAGENLTYQDSQDRERQRGKNNVGSYIVENESRGVVIDATRYRNIAGVFNHQCSGYNLERRRVVVHHADTDVWRFGLYACEDIPSGSELTWCYMKTGNSMNSEFGGLGCQCAYCIARRNKTDVGDKGWVGAGEQYKADDGSNRRRPLGEDV